MEETLAFPYHSCCGEHLAQRGLTHNNHYHNARVKKKERRKEEKRVKYSQALGKALGVRGGERGVLRDITPMSSEEEG